MVKRFTNQRGRRLAQNRHIRNQRKVSLHGRCWSLSSIQLLPSAYTGIFATTYLWQVFGDTFIDVGNSPNGIAAEKDEDNVDGGEADEQLPKSHAGIQT